MAELVQAWSVETGDERAWDHVLAHLVPEDFQDRELMNTGALALYIWTLFGKRSEEAVIAALAGPAEAIRDDD